ncbi:MAG: hypothetical protein QXS81_04905 [Candidatus Micrarchaeaceae archaeon]
MGKENKLEDINLTTERREHEHLLKRANSATSEQGKTLYVYLDLSLYMAYRNNLLPKKQGL